MPVTIPAANRLRRPHRLRTLIPWLHRALGGTAVLMLVLMAGCATRPPTSDPGALADFNETNDPIEPTNRVFYAINNELDTIILRPAAQAYVYIVPETVRMHTHNVLANLGNPVQLINDILETKPRRAGNTLMRLLVNTTIGVGGVFDVATGWGWPAHDSDAGMTLALWGLSDGPYLFLPILGPSNPRDATGFGIDYAADPTSWIGVGTTVDILKYSRAGIGALDARASVLDSLDKITQQALDPYATIRSLYRQHRQSQIDDARSADGATVPAWFPAPPAKPGAATP
jgi:phospholipid-binding lipoprotein MlaA